MGRIRSLGRSNDRFPAVVPTFDDQVYLFKTVLTFVSGPEVAIFPVECESLRDSQPIGPNLASGVRGARKGVVGRHAVSLIWS